MDTCSASYRPWGHHPSAWGSARPKDGRRCLLPSKELTKRLGKRHLQQLPPWACKASIATSVVSPALKASSEDVCICLVLCKLYTACTHSLLVILCSMHIRDALFTATNTSPLLVYDVPGCTESSLFVISALAVCKEAFF